MNFYLFSTDAELIRESLQAGVSGVVVDWENIGKYERQAHADTQINHDSVADLQRIRALTDATIIVRINGLNESTPVEIDAAVEAGADEILLPMVRTPGEVDAAIRMVGGRVPVGILVETQQAADSAPELGRLPIARAYVGLNDLAISRGSSNIFSAVADGTVERLRQHFRVPFGFAGLTHPSSGVPVPSRLLMNEMIRLGCSFTFVRRSFHADVARLGVRAVVSAMSAELAAARERNVDERESLHRELVHSITTVGAL